MNLRAAAALGGAAARRRRPPPPLRSLTRCAHGWTKAPAVTMSPAVTAAMMEGAPIVALESTIISHGMPFPVNVETACAVEEIVRRAGAVPATVAVFDGVVHVGMTVCELETLGKLGRAVRKCSRRDLALCVADGAHGSTTVAGTLAVCDMVGLRVFATGGIGGVHRDVGDTMDVSADITEMGRSPVAVVCAGVKSLLDIPRTLEALETAGVGVYALGTDEFPAFFTARSGVRAPMRLDSEAHAAAVIAANGALGLRSGLLIGVPTPAEADGAAVEAAIATALREAAAAGVRGRDVTPFILARIAELTGGASLAVNVALIKNNAAVGARIAVALAARTDGGGDGGGGGSGSAVGRGGGGGGGRFGAAASGRRGFASAAGTSAVTTADGGGSGSERGRPVVVGGAALDVQARPLPARPLPARGRLAPGSGAGAATVHTSVPGTVTQSFGGVGRNIAECLGRLAARPMMLSVVGDDPAGAALRSHLAAAGVNVSQLAVMPGMRTAMYVALFEATGGLATAVADMDAFLSIGVSVAEVVPPASTALVADANLSPDTLAALAARAASCSIPFVYEPVSVAKARRIVDAGVLRLVTVLKPNADELSALAAAVEPTFRGAPTGGGATTADVAGAEDMEALDIAHVFAAAQVVLGAMCGAPPARHGAAVGTTYGGRKHLVVSQGARGVLWMSAAPAAGAVASAERAATAGSNKDTGSYAGAERFPHRFPLARLVPAFDFDIMDVLPAEVVKNSGAGDCVVAGIVWGMHRGLWMKDAIRAGLAAAKLTLECEATVSTGISRAAVGAGMREHARLEAERDARS